MAVSAGAQPPGGHAERFIDPATLGRIANLELVARTVVEGFISGQHRTDLPGASVDFAEHRAYMPGDDLRRVDWRVYARTDRLYVKEYEADTNVNVIVVLDLSRSMDFSGEPIERGGERGGFAVLRRIAARPTKLDYAKFLSASLLYLANKQRDRVGLVSFGQDVIDFVPPSAKHLRVALNKLAAEGHAAEPVRAKSSGADADADADGTHYHRVLNKVAQTLRRRSMVVFISDLYAQPDRIARAVNQLRAGGSEVLVLHVLDPVELDLPPARALTLEDLESGRRLAVHPARTREAYLERMNAHRADLERGITRIGAHYALFDTGQPLDHALARFLAERRRMARVR
ncbi:MAG: DUF58 domain-containing protein [Gammaproteobacteria bacterium]